MKRPRQRDLDVTAIKAAPEVLAEAIRRLAAGLGDPSDPSDTRFVNGHHVCRDQAIAIVETFKRECE